MFDKIYDTSTVFRFVPVEIPLHAFRITDDNGIVVRMFIFQWVAAGFFVPFIAECFGYLDNLHVLVVRKRGHQRRFSGYI